MAAVPPSIYVGSLLDYNAGLLHGEWIDATLPPSRVLARIADLLARSPTTRRTGEPAEEWAILDSEGFAERVDPHESLDCVHELARKSRTGIS